jgi:hypothetical protein
MFSPPSRLWRDAGPLPQESVGGAPRAPTAVLGQKSGPSQGPGPSPPPLHTQDMVTRSHRLSVWLKIQKEQFVVSSPLGWVLGGTLGRGCSQVLSQGRRDKGQALQGAKKKRAPSTSPTVLQGAG